MAVKSTLTIAVCVVASAMLAGAVTPRTAQRDSSRPLIVLTGRGSEIETPRYRLTRTQEDFDAQWIEHMGERVARAAQGWPMTPRIDFEACDPVFIFGGDGTNANGYRVMDVLVEADAVTLRYERISYQTASFDGVDRGDPVRPWAMVLLPSTDKTIVLEENVQGMIGGEPVWKQRAALPRG